MYIAVITGASSGMGRECALQMAGQLKKIDELWLIARRKENMQRLKEALPADKRDRLRIFAGDLTDEVFLEDLKIQLERENPKIAFLVNASGFGKIGSVGGLSESAQTGMIRLNAEALVRLTLICLPYMADKLGRIINFASAAAFLPQPGFAVYAATKSFVLSFSEALDSELSKREISVTAVCPGPVKTEFFDVAEEYGRIAFYKRLVMASPERVVRKALRDSVNRRPVSTYGIAMKALRIISAILPHKLLFSVMKKG